MSTPTQEHDFLDLNGRQVHAFAQRIVNLGYAQMTDLLVSMLKSGAWREFHIDRGEREGLTSDERARLGQLEAENAAQL